MLNKSILFNKEASFQDRKIAVVVYRTNMKCFILHNRIRTLIIEIFDMHSLVWFDQYKANVEGIL